MRRWSSSDASRPASSGKRVHIVWYDPWLHDGAVKKQFAHSQHAVTEYRRLVAEAMKEWADENGILIEKRYYGRPVSRDNAVAGGGVRQCFAYLESLISGQNLGHTMPDAEDQAAFERLGYMPLNRTLNRGGRRQGWETTGLGPRTRSLETPLCLLCP